jgi:hypothetical protein
VDVVVVGADVESSVVVEVGVIAETSEEDEELGEVVVDTTAVEDEAEAEAVVGSVAIEAVVVEVVMAALKDLKCSGKYAQCLVLD